MKKHVKPTVSSKLRNLQITSSIDFDLGLSSGDLAADLGISERTKLLDQYTEDDILQWLKKCRVVEDLKKQGIEGVFVKFDFSDRAAHRVQVFFEKDDPKHFLIDVVMRRCGLKVTDFKYFHNPSTEFDSEEGRQCMARNIGFEIQATVVDWMLMQNPTKNFSSDRPPLPGQQHPGLGVARGVWEMMIEMATQNMRDCLIEFPEYFHNAYIYYQTGQASKFVNPSFQAFFLTLLADLEVDIAERTLASVSFAIAMNFLFDRKTGQVVKWVPQEMIFPVSKRMTAYFAEPLYARVVEKERTSGRFWIDWKKCSEWSLFHTPESGGSASS